MDNEESQSDGFARRLLPWAVAAVALLVYGVTLNHWVSFNSLSPTALALDIDWWNYKLGRPLFYLLAIPVTWLPPQTQIIALNFLSAVCAALSLALLARTVSILPFDRTHEQRLRNPDPQALFRNANDWLPPVFAVLICGFQMTFWEEATVATGEMLNLLLFAYVIRALAEFRLQRQDSWLFRAAFVYGLGMANNWAMIGFLPLFGLTVIWMKGFGFFKLRFLGVGFGLLLVGLLLYLLDPLMGALDASETATFGELLTWEFVSQRNPLLGMPKSRALMLGVTAILPLSLIAFRWPANFGDVSGFGVALAKFLIQAVHVAFLAAIVVVAFDPPFSPRQLGYGLPMLTYYYLGALMAGYLAGHVLLVCGTEPVKQWQKPEGIERVVGFVLLGAVWLGVIAVPALLLRQNLPAIRVENSDALRRFARHAAQGLPEREVVLTGSDHRRLRLLAVHFHGAPQAPLLAPFTELAAPRLHVRAAARYPEKWPAPQGDELDRPVSTPAVVQFIFGMGRIYPLWSVDDLVGTPLLESTYAEPTGLLYELYPLGTNALAAADHRHLTDDTERLKAALDPVRLDAGTGSRSAGKIAAAFSGWANTLGVRHDRLGHTNDAWWAFETALDLDTNNISAIINRDVHLALGTNGPGLSPAVSQLDSRVAENRSLGNLLRQHGPIDEATFCASFGRLLTHRQLIRQATQQFERSLELNPTNVLVRLQFAEVRQGSGRLEEARALLAEVDDFGLGRLPEDSQAEYERVLALTEYGGGDGEGAVKRLSTAIERFPRNKHLRQTLFQMHMSAAQYAEALSQLEKLLEMDPNDLQAKFNLGPVYAKLKRHDDAVKILSELIARAPTNASLFLNRGSAYNGQKKFDEAQSDYEQALELDPNSVQPYLGLAQLAVNRGNLDAARGHYEFALKLAGANSPLAREIQAGLERLKDAPAPAP